MISWPSPASLKLVNTVRIFYASDTTPNSFFKSNLWRNNLYLPLIDLGHDVVEFDYNFGDTFKHLDTSAQADKAFIAQNRPKLTVELLRQLKAAHAVAPLDMFFSYFYDACTTPEAIDEIRRMGILTVNWYCNGSYQLRLVSEIAPHYDWCLVPEKFRIPDYLAMHAHPIYCQEAANPNTYKPYALPIEYEVAFVGQAYGERPSYIKYLRDQGLDVRVWGYGWDKFSQNSPTARISPLTRARHIGQNLTTASGRQLLQSRLKYRLTPLLKKSSEPKAELTTRNVMLPAASVGGVLSDEEMIKLYSRAKINLGFSTVGETHRTDQKIVQVRLRDFEVPMSGGFYMVEYMQELEEFFEIGKEIVCYRDAADLAAKIKYYLAHDDERETIRQAGLARCLRDHTWQKRLQTSFEQMHLPHHP